MQIFVIWCNSPTTPSLLCVLRGVSRSFSEFVLGIKEIRTVTLSSPCLSPPNPSFSGIRKVRKSRYEMLKLSVKCWISAFDCTTFSRNYSSCTGRSSENLCSSSSGGAQEKRKTRWNSRNHQNWWFSNFINPLLNANVLFCRFFFQSHPVYDQTRGTHPVFSWLYGYLYCFLNSIWLRLPEEIK